jgi:1-acyl-sn-glycerol-3-phosphate acyltransferase
VSIAGEPFMMLPPMVPMWRVAGERGACLASPAPELHAQVPAERVTALVFAPAGDALIAPKHQTMFDVFVQFSALKGSLFVFKKELMAIPIFGWIALKLGSIVVDRAGQATALRDMVRRAQEQFRLEDRQLVIFPEGTRKAPGAAPDYKPGVAALYRELGVTVHPMATNAGMHWPAHGFLRRPGVIVYEFLEPIPPGLKRGEFMRRLEDSIETACGRLLAEGL